MHSVEIRRDCAVKTYRTAYAFYREMTALNAAYDFGLGISPKIISVDEEKLKIKMSLLPGVSLDKTEISVQATADIARKLAFLHLARSYSGFGAFSNGSEPEEFFGSFSVLLEKQIVKWEERLRKVSGKYGAEVSLLCGWLGRLKAGLSEGAEPFFCHNDLDLNNIIVEGSRVSGFIDWEYTGAYPLAWEIRKLIPVIYWDKPELGIVFNRAYRSVRSGVSFPDARQQAFLVALDCIGWLSWMIIIQDKQKTEEVELRLNKALVLLER